MAQSSFGIVIMSTIQDDVQKLVDKAAAMSIKAHTLSLDHGLQMQVRCTIEHMNKDAKISHVGTEINLTSPMPTMSTVTHVSSTATVSTDTLSAPGDNLAPIPLQD